MTQKKKPQKVQQDQITPKIPNLFKKKCQANGVQFSKLIKQKLDNAIEQGKFQTIQIWQQQGPLQIRFLMQSLIDLQYVHLKKMRLWKIDLQDQGVRAICSYIEKVGNNTLEYLDLMDNKITPLGCQFLGKMFLKANCDKQNGFKCEIIKFRIDNNPIGDEGVKNLAMGLRTHSKIQKLSFNYCSITQNGVKYIQQIIANIDCRLRTLKLQGNCLKNIGTYQVLRAVKNCGEYLQKLNLCDVGLNILGYKQTQQSSNIYSNNNGMMTLQQKIAHQIVSILQTNTSIAKYNFKNNWIPDVVGKQMLDAVKQNKNIFFIDMPDCIAHVLKQMQNQILKKRKLKNRGKKGKGKKTGTKTVKKTK